MTQTDSRLATACAELIRFWHEHYGLAERPSRMDETQFHRYRDRIEHFRNADLSDRRSQEEIAEEQRSGVFEWHYSAAIPVELWKNIGRQYELVDHGSPQHLGEAAKWIFESPRFVEARPSLEEESRRTLPAETETMLFEQVHEFYADVVAEHALGVGGVNVLLSCSLERYPWSPQEHQLVTLLRPQALGLRLIAKGERRDDLVDALRQGELVVKNVIGGPRHSILDSDRSGESDGER